MRECPPPLANPSRPRLKLPAGACDTHCHVFGPADRFPFSPDRAYTPDDAPKERLAALHELLGISRTVFVQASCHGFDNSAMLDAIAHAPETSRGIAQIEMDCSHEEIARLHEGGVRGARFNFMTRISPMPDTTEIDGLLSRIKPFGWHAVLHFDSHLIPALAPWMRQLDMPFVIDHMGRLLAVDAHGPNHLALLELVSSCENAWVKISGAERGSAAGPPFADMTAIARSLAEAAPDRTLWGTDWPHPVLSGPMPDDGQLVDLLADFVPDEAVRHRVLVDNPARLYGF
jgi:predicted TIM-barrel fold metal-dependent hydrolase